MHIHVRIYIAYIHNIYVYVNIYTSRDTYMYIYMATLRANNFWSDCRILFSVTYSERALWDGLDGMFSSKCWKLANFEKNTKAIAHGLRAKMEVVNPRDNEQLNRLSWSSQWELSENQNSNSTLLSSIRA